MSARATLYVYWRLVLPYLPNSGYYADIWVRALVVSGSSREHPGRGMVSK